MLMPYVLGVPVDLPLEGPPGKPRLPAVKRADDLLHHAKIRDQWERRSCGTGTKGTRVHDRSAFAVNVKGESPAEGHEHWLGPAARDAPQPARQGRTTGPRDRLLPRPRPREHPRPEIIAQAGGRWQIEEDNEINKQLVGLDQYQARKWTPRHRHITACMLATAFPAVQRATFPEREAEEGCDLGKDASLSESEAAG
jgi:hypothetical protein